MTPAATPDDAAQAFTVAYLSWEWDRSMPAMQAGVRPYVTDELYGRLATEPSPQWTNPGGVDVHEVDTPRVVSATNLDSDAAVARVLVAVLVTQRTDSGSTDHPVALVVRIKQESGSWKVDGVDR